MSELPVTEHDVAELLEALEYARHKTKVGYNMSRTVGASDFRNEGKMARERFARVVTGFARKVLNRNWPRHGEGTTLPEGVEARVRQLCAMVTASEPWRNRDVHREAYIARRILAGMPSPCAACEAEKAASQEVSDEDHTCDQPQGRTIDADLAAEAAAWDATKSGRMPEGWEDAPGRIPNRPEQIAAMRKALEAHEQKRLKHERLLKAARDLVDMPDGNLTALTAAVAEFGEDDG